MTSVYVVSTKHMWNPIDIVSDVDSSSICFS
jgi:hypothetical protein